MTKEVIGDILIIGDIGGQFDALMRLVRGWLGLIVLVGDPNDRGPKSRQVIEWCIANEDRVLLLHSNHAEILTDFYHGGRWYDPGFNLQRNGLYQTLVSYDFPVPKENYLNLGDVIRWVKNNIPKEHIEFLETRPLYFETEDLIVTHAPLINDRLLYKKELSRYEREVFVWNRERPRPLKKWQVFGHNSTEDRHRPEQPFGLSMSVEEKWICLDDSAREMLTGLVWPDRVVLQEPFVERVGKEPDVSPG